MKRAIVIIIPIVIIYFLCIFILTIPSIKTKQEVYSNFNEEYIDVVDAKSIFKDYKKDIIVEGNVDTSKVGEYKLTYILDFKLFKIKKDKLVIIKDIVKPIIKLKGQNISYVCPSKTYEEEGYSATDNYDGNITDKVVQQIKDNKIIYRVSDNSGNLAEVERKIEYIDKDKPSITLNGNSNITLYQYANYNEEGYSAIDNCDGDITDKVEVENNLDTSKIGEYQIIYKVSDSSSNVVEVKRIINVITKPVVYSSRHSGSGKIYLTFDDGPSDLTSQILQILDEEGIKATFFVTSAVNSYPSVLINIYNRGNAVALHTYSHDYSYIYSSSANYYSDLEKIKNAVNNIIGFSPNIIRFPGGSSNTVSRNYCIGIMSELSQSTINNGYNYFDWNIDSDDAGSAYQNSSRIYTNVISNLSHDKVNIVLMHDSAGHNATVAALRDIIKFGKNNGYSFDIITNDTKSVRHGINN